MGVWRWRYVFNIVYETIDVIIVIGTFTMSVRRFHDVGRTMLIPLIMLISILLRGLIVLLKQYLMCIW